LTNGFPACDLLVENIGELATVAGNNARPRTGEAFADAGLVRDAAVAISDARVLHTFIDGVQVYPSP